MSEITEDQIEQLRLLAFKTNNPAHIENYRGATVHWFQSRQYRELETSARISELEAENERLRNALEPFAEVAGRFDGLAVSAILPQQCWFTPHSLREARAARATIGDKSAPSEPSKEQIERAIEAYGEGVYLTDEQVHASVTAIVRAALSPSPQPKEAKP